MRDVCVCQRFSSRSRRSPGEGGRQRWLKAGCAQPWALLSLQTGLTCSQSPAGSVWPQGLVPGESWPKKQTSDLLLLLMKAKSRVPRGRGEC